MLRLLPVIFLLGTFLACQEKQLNSEQPGSGTESVSKRKGPYRVVKYLRRSQTCVSPDSLCASVTFIYPHFYDPAQSALNDSIRADVAAYSGVADPEVPLPLGPEILAREFTGNFDAFVRSQQGQPFYGNVWALEVTAKPLRQTPGYLGLQLDAYSYEGGAHGNYSTRFLNYDPRTGHRIQLGDLIRKDAQASLKALAEKMFRQQEGLQPSQKLEDDYFFEDGRFQLNDNFTLTAQGLRFVYNPYEIKPYAAGQTTLELPWSDLRPLLNPGVPGLP